MRVFVMDDTAKRDERNYGETQFESGRLWRKTQKETPMRILFGIAIVAVVAFTAWSVEPTVGKTPSTVSLDPHAMMATTGNLPQAHYHDYSTIY
jgi:hypothetical protein